MRVTALSDNPPHQVDREQARMMMMIRIVMIDIAHTLADAVSGQPGVRHEEVLVGSGRGVRRRWRID
jgi:hypothetical protein